MKKKHLIKLIDLLLDNNAFVTDPYTRQGTITNDMRNVLTKLRGKDKGSKLQNAVTTIIKEQKRRGEEVTGIPDFQHIPPPPPPPPSQYIKEGENPKPMEPRIRVIPEGGKQRYMEEPKR